MYTDVQRAVLPVAPMEGGVLASPHVTWSLVAQSSRCYQLAQSYRLLKWVFVRMNEVTIGALF